MTDEQPAGMSRGRLIGILIGAFLAGGLVILLIAGLINADQELSIDRRIAEGDAQTAADFTLPVLFAGGDVGPVGKDVSLSSLRGRPVVLNFWASWCEPCREEAPRLERLWQTYRDRGTVVLGVNTQDGTREAMAFIREVKTTFPSLRDGSDATTERYETFKLPETFVIDPDGKMRFKPVRGGLNAVAERQIAEHLDAVLP